MSTKDKQETNEEFQYFNDEWNPEIEEHPIVKDVKKFKIIKNNKPDGRRYKK